MNCHESFHLFHWLVIVVWLGASSFGSGGTVPIVVKGDGAPAAWPAPVKFGVPFPRETLGLGEPVVVVDEGDTPRLVQTRVLATWDPKGEKGIRWLLMEFLAERGKSYRLLFGDEAGKASPEMQDIVRETTDAFEVDTGALRARCSKNALDVFKSFQARYRTKDIVPMMRQSVWAGPYLEHEKRGIFRADLNEAAEVVLEENGPIRATLKADGWYANEEGERFCRFGLRLHFFRGKRYVKLEHTFIFTGHSNQDRLRSVSIQLPLFGKRNPRFSSVFSAELAGGGTVGVPVENSSDHVYQTMDSPDRD